MPHNKEDVQKMISALRSENPKLRRIGYATLRKHYADVLDTSIKNDLKKLPNYSHYQSYILSLALKKLVATLVEFEGTQPDEFCEWLCTRPHEYIANLYKLADYETQTNYTDSFKRKLAEKLVKCNLPDYFQSHIMTMTMHTLIIKVGSVDLTKIRLHDFLSWSHTIAHYHIKNLERTRNLQGELPNPDKQPFDSIDEYLNLNPNKASLLSDILSDNKQYQSAEYVSEENQYSKWMQKVIGKALDRLSTLDRNIVLRLKKYHGQESSREVAEIASQEIVEFDSRKIAKHIADAAEHEVEEVTAEAIEELAWRDIAITTSQKIAEIASHEIEAFAWQEITTVTSRTTAEAASEAIQDFARQEIMKLTSRELANVASQEIAGIVSREIAEITSQEIGKVASRELAKVTPSDAYIRRRADKARDKFEEHLMDIVEEEAIKNPMNYHHERLIEYLHKLLEGNNEVGK